MIVQLFVEVDSSLFERDGDICKEIGAIQGVKGVYEAPDPPQITLEEIECILEKK